MMLWLLKFDFFLTITVHLIYLLCLFRFSWERRVDGRNRVYYVDHNTRTTTWQRPTQQRIQNFANWRQQQENMQNQRNVRVFALVAVYVREQLRMDT